MKDGAPRRGFLYSTTSGRTAEILAHESLEVTSMVDSPLPVARAEVIAWKYVGGSVVHLASVDDVREWIKVPGDD